MSVLPESVVVVGSTVSYWQPPLRVTNGGIVLMPTLQLVEPPEIVVKVGCIV